MLEAAPKFMPKALKPGKHRIRLLDGRELQYHCPQNPQNFPINLSGFVPQEFQASIEVEIGPGKGEFLAARAARFPDRFFIGIDRRLDRFRLTEKKLLRIEQSAANWKVIREDARSFLDAGLPPIRILHVYHPDPWPKARHHKHRFFRSPDARLWALALKTGGELRLSTDHAGYFQEILDICQSWDFLKLGVVYQKEHYHAPPQSHFEGIFLKKKEPIFKAIFFRL